MNPLSQMFMKNGQREYCSEMPGFSSWVMMLANIGYLSLGFCWDSFQSHRSSNLEEVKSELEGPKTTISILSRIASTTFLPVFGRS